jgi:hypothetical protein
MVRLAIPGGAKVVRIATRNRSCPLSLKIGFDCALTSRRLQSRFLLLQYLYATVSLSASIFPILLFNITCQPCSSIRFFTQIISNQVIPVMGKRPLVTHVHISPYPKPHGFFHNLPSCVSILTRVVSPDATIAIVFGLIGVILSLAGIIIACLTLRFMMTEKCMLSLLLLPSSSLLAIV